MKYQGLFISLIVFIINKKSYLVRTENDLEIKNNSVKFKNNNGGKYHGKIDY